MGTRSTRKKKGYGLRQEKYIEELLSRRAGQPLPKIVEGEDEEHHELGVVLRSAGDCGRAAVAGNSYAA